MLDNLINGIVWIVLAFLAWEFAIGFTEYIFEMIGFYGVMFILILSSACIGSYVFQLKSTVKQLELEGKELRERLDKNFPSYEE